MHPKNLITTDFIDLDASSNACLYSRDEVRKDAIIFSHKIQRVDYENRHIAHEKFLSYRARLN